ncbi:5611_t:CDS:1, partial [Gigaspora rosea]
ITIGISFQDDWLKFIEITRMYEAASNTRVNKSKIVLIPIPTAAQKYNLPSEIEFRKLAKDKPITILRHKMDSGGNPIKYLWEELACTVQNKI